MREAISRAEVGDDAFGDDPTVRRLEERIADLLGKESALFFPSGTMANETAILVFARSGSEVVVEASCHLFDWEDAAAAAWAGAQLRPVATQDGILAGDTVRAAIRPDTPYQPRTALICVENTHNAAGGRVVPIEALREVRAAADERGLPIHMDGARLWNASVASGVPLSDYAAVADTVMVTLSKGLGCPVGSLLAGKAAVIQEAWRVRRRLGGSMRQAGLLAAAGLYALDHNVDRLAEDHRRASLLADLAGQIEGVRAVPPDTNIVMLDLLRDEPDAPTVLTELTGHGVLMSMFASHRLRAVTHLDVDDEAIRSAVDTLAEAIAPRH